MENVFMPDLSGVVPTSWHTKASITFLASDGQANVIASSEPVSPDIAPAEYAEAQGRLLREEFPSYRELRFESATIFGGKSGFRRRFTWLPPDSVEVYQIQLYYVEEARGYTATATTPAARRPVIEPELSSILNGLRLGPRTDTRWVRSESPDTTRKRVQALLTSNLGPVHVDQRGWYSIPSGSARLWVEVTPWRDPGGLVTVFALTNRQVPRSMELFEFLATHSEELMFGRLGAWRDGDDSVTTVFRYSLLGSTLDPEELRNAVEAIAETADRLDDLIRSRFGGELLTRHDPRYVPVRPVTSEDHRPESVPPEEELPTGFYL